MVIKHIKRFFESQKMRLAKRRKEKEQAESFKETEEMKQAEEIKREADRLAQLKQYTTAIEEYNKALEFYPYKGNEENLFKNAAEFLFKCNYNMAACYSYLDNFDESISHVDAWYSKGHMEILMGKIKDAVQSFDNVINTNKNYENKENISLYDEIKREKGIQIKASEIMERDNSEPSFRTKTGHLVRTRAEMEIANFLFDNSLLFQYNAVATWADKDDFRASFYIPKLDLYIDHHPYDYLKEYQKIMKTKVKQYEKHKKKHVYVTSEDEKNIEEALKLKLKPYIIL